MRLQNPLKEPFRREPQLVCHCSSRSMILTPGHDDRVGLDSSTGVFAQLASKKWPGLLPLFAAALVHTCSPLPRSPLTSLGCFVQSGPPRNCQFLLCG